jgi:hypothetical protein
MRGSLAWQLHTKARPPLDVRPPFLHVLHSGEKRVAVNGDATGRPLDRGQQTQPRLPDAAPGEEDLRRTHPAAEGKKRKSTGADRAKARPGRALFPHPPAEPEREGGTCEVRAPNPPEPAARVAAPLAAPRL